MRLLSFLIFYLYIDVDVRIGFVIWHYSVVEFVCFNEVLGFVRERDRDFDVHFLLFAWFTI